LCNGRDIIDKGRFAQGRLLNDYGKYIYNGYYKTQHGIHQQVPAVTVIKGQAPQKELVEEVDYGEAYA
jgi:hypothetical protein